MKKYIVLSMLIVLVLISCNLDTAVVYDISAKRFLSEIDEAVKKGDQTLIIDTRSEKDYNSGHIRYAINLPHNHLDEGVYKIQYLIKTPIYVYNTNIDKSFKSAKILAKNGFKTVYNCEGTEEHTYKFVRYKYMPTKDFFILAQNEYYVLIDYRSESYYNRGHAKNATFIELGHLNEQAVYLPQADGYLIYSFNGKIASDCAEEMIELGFRNVSVCMDDINYYREYMIETE